MRLRLDRAWGGALRGRLTLLLSAAVLLAGLCGCRRTAVSDETVERYLALSRDLRVNGRSEESEQTLQRILQSRPDHARAHRELGMLYFQNLEDYLAALYHFDRYLELEPEPRSSDVQPDVLQAYMDMCRQEIAVSVPLGGITLDLRDRIETQVKRNEALAEENRQLKEQLAAARQANLKPATTQTPPQPGSRPLTTPATGTTPQGVPSNSSTTNQRSSRPTQQANRLTTLPSGSPTRPRTHRIQKGDTLYSVARRYNLDARQVIAANPSVDPRNMQIGQVIVLPAPTP